MDHKLKEEKTTLKDTKLKKKELFKKVIVLKTPITDRYCVPGDEASLDVENNQIRCKDAWFDFDERWEVQHLES